MHRLDFVMSDNVMMLAGSSNGGLVDRIRSGSQLEVRLGPDDANQITWSWSLGSKPVGDRHRLRESGTSTSVLPRLPNGQGLWGFMHQPPLHLSPPARLCLQCPLRGSGAGPCN